MLRPGWRVLSCSTLFSYFVFVLKVIGRGHLPETVKALKEHPELQVRFGDVLGCGAGVKFE